MDTLQNTLGKELADQLKQAIHLMGEEAVQQDQKSSNAPKKSVQEAVKSVEAETVHALEKLANELAQGATILQKSVKELTETHHDINYDKACQELQEATKSFSPDTIRELSEQLARQETLTSRRVLQISDATWEALSLAAMHLLDNKRYEEAVKAFALLSSIDATDAKNWAGYGHAAFASEQYDIALVAYYMTSSLMPNNAWPLIWCADVYEKKGEYLTALDLLRSADNALKGNRQSAGLINELQHRIHDLELKRS